MEEGKNPEEKPQDTPKNSEQPLQQPKRHMSPLVAIIGIAVGIVIQYEVRKVLQPKPPRPDYSSILKKREPLDMRTMAPHVTKSIFTKQAEKLDITTFQPPKEGVILDKYTPEDGDKSKSPIIIVPSVEVLMAEDPEVAAKAQEETFDIIAYLITKYGDANLVAENWPKGLSTEMIVDKILSDPSTPEEGRRIMKDPKARVENFRKAAKGGFPVNIALILAFQDKITATGTTSMEGMQNDMQETQAVMQAGQTASQPEQIQCQKDTKLSVGEAIKNVDTQKKSSKTAVECACDFRFQIMSIIGARVAKTTGEIPEKEANSAIEANDKKPARLTIIVSAPLHASKQIETLKGKKTPYIVISPRSIERLATEALKDKQDYLRKIREDSDMMKTPSGKKKCEKWEENGGR